MNENSTTYQVNILFSGVTGGVSGQNISTTAWLLKDGTVVALDLPGHSFIGTAAAAYFQDYFSMWELDAQYGVEAATLVSSSYFHTTGTSTLQFGPSKFSVTNYAATSIPETIPYCYGESLSSTSGGVFSVGTPSGSNYRLVTHLVAGGSGVSVSSSGAQSTTTFNFVSTITSVTVAERQ